MTRRGSEERTNALIALARSNPQLASQLIAQLPADAQATLLAALAKPPVKAVRRAASHQERAAQGADRSTPAGPGIASTARGQTAYSAQLQAFAKSVGRVK